jgi:transcriptional regulator GlxA family with amidase domain
VRRRDLDRLSASLVESYDHALERGEADVLARVAEALWIKVVAERVPEVRTVDLAVLRAAADVLERPERAHTLRSLARRAGLSRSRFSARFTEALGESPMRWVQTVRMRHAQALLRGGKQSVAAVAEQLGFDESAFRKAYRRIIGTPPRSGLG